MVLCPSCKIEFSEFAVACPFCNIPISECARVSIAAKDLTKAQVLVVALLNVLSDIVSKLTLRALVPDWGGELLRRFKRNNALALDRARNRL